MEKENQEEKKSIKMKEKEEKKALKLKKKEEKKSAKLEKKEKNKTKKKLDKTEIFKKIMAAFLIAFTLIGTCYTFIYLVING